MNRHAVAFAEIKALDSEQRIVEGWASRVEVDRQGDIVEARGLQPPRGKINLLLDHNHSNAVGVVEDLKAHDQGVRFRARLAKITQPGALKELCDDAWQMVVGGLRSAVSIGFKPIDSEPMPNGGVRFKTWEILELSLVAVPACAGATIDTIKSLDRELIRKAGRSRVSKLGLPVVRLSVADYQRAGVKPPSRVVKLAGDPLSRAKVVQPAAFSDHGARQENSVCKAVEAVIGEMENATELAKTIKAIGYPAALALRANGALAHATDAELADLHARLAALERKR